MNKFSEIGKGCEFCDEFAGGYENSFAIHYANQIASRVIMDQHHFRVLPSLGQIVPGYLLLVPERHYLAFADMSRDELKSAEKLKLNLATVLRDAYGEYLFFEHGPRKSGAGGCGVSHAHLHAVPFPYEKDPVARLIHEFAFEEVSGLLDLQRLRSEDSYIYYEALSGKRYVFRTPFVPSQHVRRLLAEALGLTRWDWRESTKEETLLSTLTRASYLLAHTPC
jgi:diadenosine tetraphosphate (Ap4A) HIT family hydrolase